MFHFSTVYGLSHTVIMYICTYNNNLPVSGQNIESILVYVH